MIIENQRIDTTLRIQNYSEDIIIRNCTLESSVYIKGANIKFTNCEFDDTVHVVKGLDVEITNCKFNVNLKIIESEKTTIRNSVFNRSSFETLLYGSNGVTLEKVVVCSDALSILTSSLSTEGSILIKDSLIHCPTFFNSNNLVRVTNSRLHLFLETTQLNVISFSNLGVIFENSELIFLGRRKNEIVLYDSFLLLLNSRIISNHFVSLVPIKSRIVFISNNVEYTTNKVLYLFSEQIE